MILIVQGLQPPHTALKFVYVLTAWVAKLVKVVVVCADQGVDPVTD